MEDKTPQDSGSETKGGGSASAAPGHFSIELERIQDYEFRVKFDKGQYQEVMTDEPPPIGKDKAPNASRLLAAAVGNCLSASLLFCAERSRANIKSLRATVNVQHARNEHGRLRIGKIDVEIIPEVDETDRAKLERCLGKFEDFCVVTQSVRQGIDVSVSVKS
jgi:uncharacterized OsmC-like protein